MKKSDSHEEITGRFLRTVLRPEVYEGLEDYAKTLATGLGKWDFGVAIERLLETARLEERFQIIEAKLNELSLSGVDKQVKKENSEPKEQLLGKHHKGEKKK